MKKISQKQAGLEKIFGTALLIVLATLLLTGCAANSQPVEESNNAPSSTTDASPETSDEVSEQKYEDGTYTASGDYTSPAGAEEVEITLTLDDGVITDAEFVGKAEHPTSQKLQGMFAEGYKEVVVGKSIDELSLTVVNGSSLAPKGFMDAVADIKDQAEANA